MASVAQPRPARVHGSFWKRLGVAAILLLIGLNILYFGGNAALDLAQIASPAHRFTGTITDHQEHLTTTEDPVDELVLTIKTNDGRTLNLDMPQHTFDATSVGQQVSGTMDPWGVFGHDEAVRSLSANGQQVYASRTFNRGFDQVLILAITLFVGALAARWAWLSSHPRPPKEAGPASTTFPDRGTPPAGG